MWYYKNGHQIVWRQTYLDNGEKGWKGRQTQELIKYGQRTVACRENTAATIHEIIMMHGESREPQNTIGTFLMRTRTTTEVQHN